jgi:hypothetical protein
MSILAILLVLVLLGVALWAIQTFIPMPTPYKRALIVIIIVLVIIWLLRVTGVWGEMGAMRV